MNRIRPYGPDSSTPRAGGFRRAVLIALGAALVAAPSMGRADSVTLSWTATGDDGSTGRASAYELRFSQQPVVAGDTTGWWSNATTAGILPAPATAGTRESYTMSGLVTGTTFYFVLRVADEVPNWSTYSNVRPRMAGGASGTLATPASFTARAVAGGVDLSWDEPASGAGSGYHLYKSTSGGPDSLVATLGVSTTAWSDTTIAGGVTYRYTLATYQGSSEGTPTTATISVPADLLAAATTGIHGYPNPAHGRVTLRFPGGDKNGAPGRVRVSIYDLTGHLVSRLVDQVLPAGDQTFEWLCRSDAGNPVAPGLYNAILDSSLGRMIARIAVVP